MEFKKKILLIRFSSFGDVTQSLSVATRLSEMGGEARAEVHWVVRSDFAPLINGHPAVTRLWCLDKKEGLKGLLKLILRLRQENFTHIFDAHNNLRSHLIAWMLTPPLHLRRIFSPPDLLRKSQKRWKRLLLFRFRINLYRQPFSGQRDLLEPLKRWGLSETLPPPPQIFVEASVLSQVSKRLAEKGFSRYVALAPSAAHTLKRWPLEHWKTLIRTLSSIKFVVLGGAEDFFLHELEKEFPSQVLNWAGQTSFSESIAVVKNSLALVTNDTGVLHIGEQLGHATLALMGPAPFGFPSRTTTDILQLPLKCRPCSKHGQGPCVNPIYQQCLRDILPQTVARKLLERISP